MRIFENGKYRDLTPEEVAKAEKQEILARIIERSRPLSESEVFSMLLTQNIQTIEVDDATAIRMKGYYPEWEPGKAYAVGHKMTRGGKLYKVLQAHTSQVGWEPESVPAMFAEINETHDGSLEDPIPYDGNMALEQGKHYIQNDEIYICTRDTGNPIYHALADLIGIYVEEV